MRSKTFVFAVTLLLVFGGMIVVIEENPPKNLESQYESKGLVQTDYRLTINIEGSGSTNPVEGNHTYQDGEVVKVEATPANG